MHALAIDPGKMTGLAVSYDGQLERAWAEPYDEALKYCVSRIEFGEYDAVVIEDFVITERTTRVNAQSWKRGQELEFIGVIRWICRQMGVPFKTQTPSQAKSFSTDDKLKRLGWWTKGLDHPRDATRHLILYLVQAGELDPRDLINHE